MPRLLPLLAGLLALAGACCGGPVPPLTRLAFGTGGAQPRQVGTETRPSFVLEPGQTLATAARLAPGSTLRFAWSLLRTAPGRGEVELEARVDGRVVDRRRVPARPAEGWWPVTIPLASAGRTRFEFRATLVGGDPPGPRPDAWIALAAPRVTGPPAERRRVLVWISLDTVRADHLGAYGYPRATSPRFDGFAGEAVLFERAVAPASWTLPSLASQFTSRYPTYHGGVLQRLARDTAQPTVFDLLAREGFTVLGVTGNRFVSHEFGMASGFDALRFTGARAEEVSRLAVSLLDDWAGGDVVLFVHYMDPHAAYQPPPPYDTLFDHDYGGRVNGRNFESLRAGADPADVAHVKALYDGELAYTDESAGALLTSLEGRGLLGDAVVLWTADHGEEFLDHGGWTHSRTLYEEMLHVPFALRVPGLAPRRESAPVTLVDVAPTLLDAFGLRAPASFQGGSLLPLLSGGRRSPSPLLAESERNPEALHRVSLREGSLKYVLVARRGRHVPPRVVREETFDLAADPAEVRALGDVPGAEALRRRALAYLTRARTEARPPRHARVAAEVEEELKALGYVQ